MRRFWDRVGGLSSRIIVLTALLFLAVLGMSLFSFNAVIERINENLGGRLATQQAITIRSQMMATLTRELALARQMADSPLLRQWAEDENDPRLRRQALESLESFRRSYTSQSYFFVLNRSLHYYYNNKANTFAGKEIVYTLNQNVQKDAWYFGTLEHVRDYALNVDYDFVVGVFNLWINVPMRKPDGTPLGVVGTGLDMSGFIQSFIEKPEVGIENILIDRQFAIQAHRNKTLIDRQSIGHTERHSTLLQLARADDAPLLKAALQRLDSHASEAESLLVHINGQQRLIGIAPIPELRYYVVSVLDVDSVVGRQSYLVLLVSVVLALLVMVVAVWVMVERLIIRRLRQLVAATGSMQRGERVVELAPTRQDELGELMVAFTSMSRTIRSHTEELGRKVQERTVQLAEAKQIAERASQAKSDFLANISHEIRTPMNAIMGLTELVLDTELTPAQRDHLSKIKTSSRLLHNVLNDVLDISKIESGKLTIEAVYFDLREAVQEALHLYDNAARDKHLALHCEIADEVPSSVIGDPYRLTQVLGNLLSNAIKFTEQGEVRLTVSSIRHTKNDCLLQFAVRDTGIGLSVERAARLFQPFTQGDASVTRKYGGTGLGLSICKQLVQMMGGEISVAGAEGQGSTFTFSISFTVARDIGDLASPFQTLPALESLRGKRVLLVDDGELNRQIVAAFLARLGVASSEADSAREALSKMAVEHFDAVLMDVQMPEMDGLEATRQIRSNPAWQRLPIIAMSAGVFKEDRAACLAAGMNDFISKPVHPDQLYAVVAHWLTADATAGVAPAIACTESPASAAALDLSDLHERLGKNRRKVEEFVHKFILQTRSELTQVEVAAQAHDSAALQRWGHHLRSPAHMVGAYQVAELCGQLERLDEAHLEAAAVIVSELHSALETVEKQLHDALEALA